MQQFLKFCYWMFTSSSTCFGRPHAHHQELNNRSSSLWFYSWSAKVAGNPGTGDGRIQLTENGTGSRLLSPCVGRGGEEGGEERRKKWKAIIMIRT